MIYARKGHIHNSQAWYIRITNLNAAIHRLAEGFTPTTPNRKKRKNQQKFGRIIC